MTSCSSSVVVAFFALMVGLVAVCDRIIGRDEDSDLARPRRRAGARPRRPAA